MASKCFMCGRDVSHGTLLCDRCDKPRKGKPPEKTATSPQTVRYTAPVESPAAQRGVGPSTQRAAKPEEALDAFPKAPVVPFPRDSVSPAITSVVNILVAAGVPSILVGPDHTVKFVSDEAMRLFDATQSDLSSLAYLESKAGLHVGDLSIPTSSGMRIRERNVIYSLVPMSGGAGGAVLVFRPADPMGEAHASFVAYVRETVLGPLRSLRDSIYAAAEANPFDPFLGDTVAALEGVLSSLEMAPEVDERSPGARPLPTVTDVVRRVADRFVPFADLKGIHLQVDAQDLEERFQDHDQLAEALGILMDNALHYVPPSGQVVIGVRWMEHKGKPLLLFFVMDTGPLVPEQYKLSIFEPDFVWHPSQPERTGRGLFKVREFAVGHAGSVWVESKTGKACTFFLRVRPDGVR